MIYPDPDSMRTRLEKEKINLVKKEEESNLIFRCITAQHGVLPHRELSYPRLFLPQPVRLIFYIISSWIPMLS
jgi:hypothetical protein